MKQSDIMLVVVVVFISGILSYFVSNMLFGGPTKTKTKYEVVEKISSDFSPADPRYFNETSINPTQLIQIGREVNQQPF